MYTTIYLILPLWGLCYKGTLSKGNLGEEKELCYNRNNHKYKYQWNFKLNVILHYSLSYTLSNIVGLIHIIKSDIKMKLEVTLACRKIIIQPYKYYQLACGSLQVITSAAYKRIWCTSLQMAPEGSPFYTTMKRGGLGHEEWKGSNWLLLKDSAGGQHWGMDVWYAARHQII